jgi:hypothetical protein
MAKLDYELRLLTTMSKAQLRERWVCAYRSPAPNISATLMALGIAHRLQARRSVDLPSATLRELRQLGAVLDRDGSLSTEPMATIKLGTSLVRSWHGVTHQVLIIKEGYVYRDAVYRSLSEIARDITGARWSGPRFFGLTGKGRAKPPPPGKPSASTAHG